MEKLINIHLRGLPLEVKKKLRSMAGAQDKSLNQLCIEILIKAAKGGD